MAAATAAFGAAGTLEPSEVLADATVAAAPPVRQCTHTEPLSDM